MRDAPVVVRDIAGARALLRERGRGPVALVPTMGALHEGHLSLVRRANALNFSGGGGGGGQKIGEGVGMDGAGGSGTVVVSVFVNPLQFGAGEDFAEYPRDLASDVERLRGLADVVFAPEAGEMYPAGAAEFGIALPPLAGELEGRFRPGFFEGVAAAVCKLLHIVSPDVAVFGAKDCQQAALVSGMVRGLNFPVAVEVAPTVREADGLALSSRNVYLSAAERAEAPRLYGELRRAARAIAGGSDVVSACATGAEVLRENGWSVDYFEARDAGDLSLPAAGRPVVVLAAARLGGTRLIDNAGAEG